MKNIIHTETKEMIETNYNLSCTDIANRKH